MKRIKDLSKIDIGMGIFLFLTYIFQFIMYEFNIRFFFPFKMMTVLFAIYWYLLKRKRYTDKWKRRFILPLEWAGYMLIIGLLYAYIIYQTEAIWLIGF
jgi:hypothetical protein